MARKIDTDANINSIRFSQQMSHPASPASGYESLYIISGSAHGGLYVKDSGGRQIGPFITGSSSGGGRTLIQEATPTGVGTASFTGIPGTYKKLTLEFAIRSTQAAAAVNGKINLNGDTTAGNYRYTEHFAYGTTTVGANGGDDCIFTTGISGGSAPAGSFSTGKIEIIQYANTNFNKQVGYSGNHRRDASSLFEITYRASVEWENTAAITQVDIVLSAGNFETGSVLRLYGES